MNDWLGRERPVTALFVVLISVGLVVVAGMAGCTSRAGKGEGPASANAQPSLASAGALEPYPLIPLRTDLGEFLIEDEKTYVRHALESVERVIKFRMTDQDIQSTRIGAGNHRGDHGTPHGCYPAGFTIQPRDEGKVAAGIADARNHGTTFPAIVRFSNSETTDVDDLRSASIGLALKIDLQRAGYSDADFLPGSQQPGAREQDFLTGTSRTFLSPGHQGLQLALREAGRPGDHGHRPGDPDPSEGVLRSTARPQVPGEKRGPAPPAEGVLGGASLCVGQPGREVQVHALPCVRRGKVRVRPQGPPLPDEASQPVPGDVRSVLPDAGSGAARTAAR